MRATIKICKLELQFQKFVSLMNKSSSNKILKKPVGISVVFVSDHILL